MNAPSRIYDLSQPVFPNCPQYPDQAPRPAQIHSFYLLAVQGVNKEIVEMSTHTGTHCDAPYHFFDAGKTVDQIPLETYVGPATLFDLRGKPPGSAIGPEDLAGLDRLQPGSIALLNTGGGHRRANTADFLTRYVYLGAAGAEALVARGVKGVGIDAVSLGAYDDPAKAGAAHRAVLGSGAFITEELYFPDAVMDGRERLFVAAPVKLQGCSGAWTRAMLWEFD
jgi:kynurenine formamidase